MKVNAMYLKAFRKRKYLLALFALNFFLLTSCKTMPTRIEKEPWFLSAKDYVEGYEMAQRFGSTPGEKALSSMAQILRAKENYLNSKQPAPKEILALLNSNEDEKTKIGLGAMALQPLSEYEVLKKMIIFFDHPSKTHRDFARMALLIIHRDEIKEFQDLGDMIFEYAKKTNDYYVLSDVVQILGKFNNQKYLPFIMKYLKKNDNPLFFYSSFIALKEMDDKYFQQVRSQLQREGDTEILRNFNQTDDLWKKIYGNERPSTPSDFLR